MILIDSRESLPSSYSTPTTGAGDFLTLFQSHRSHPRAEIRTLPAADFAITGHPTLPSMAAIERKTLKGLFKDKRDGRLAGEQLPKLFDFYDPSLVFLLIESEYRVNDTGYIEEYFPATRRWLPSKLGSQQLIGLELDSFLTTLSIKTPITVKFTRNPTDTVEWVCSLQHYFAEPLDKRHDHIGLHTPPERAMIAKAGTVRRVVAALNGVGWERSFAVAERIKQVYCGRLYPTPLEGNVPCCLVHMEPSDWCKFDGFGRVLSERVVGELRGMTKGRMEGGTVE